MNQDQITAAEGSIEEAINTQAEHVAKYSTQTMTLFIADDWPLETTIGDFVALKAELEAAVFLAARNAALKTLAAIRLRAPQDPAQDTASQDRSSVGRAE